MNQESKWYVLYTAPRAEKKVADRLIKEGFEIFLPIYKAKRKWSDRVKEVELPLFNSYVFVHCPNIKLRYSVLVPGVVKVVYYVGRPAVVTDAEIEAIKDFLNLSNKNKIISVGDMVSILGGVLEKKSGEVTKIGERFTYLYIESLDATVCIENINIEKKS